MIFMMNLSIIGQNELKMQNGRYVLCAEQKNNSHLLEHFRKE